ncbi:MAG: hypothetical protein IT373_15160 [Polyangiaceae bacterium]|nr:hypothetical protein [Polyangiaceae bacterium]
MTAGRRYGLGLSLGVLGVVALGGCGPKRIQVNPTDVSALTVRPASGQDLYCPGDRFLVEVLATMKDGSSCSSANPQLTCLGGTGVVIDPETIHLEGTSGGPAGDPLVWLPDENPLATAATGMSLKAWLQGLHEGKAARSVEAARELRPVYQCQRDHVLAPLPAPPGAPGSPGAAITVSVTTLSTPFYAAAALVRVEAGGERRYLISSSFDETIRVVSRGQDGGPGQPGAQGLDGAPGQSAAPDQPCARGGRGGHGTAGAQGGPGASGGSGGTIRLVLDAAAADKLRGRILADNPGGYGGPGGPGGRGGFGGAGGTGGRNGPGCEGTSLAGDKGTDGPVGMDGPVGPDGPPGPPVVVETAPRETLFAGELELIRSIEATPGKR